MNIKNNTILACFLTASSLSYSSHVFSFSGIDSDADGVFDSVDVDDDGDGLIEISTLDELNNIRYNLSGTAYNDGETNDNTGCGNNSDVTACNGYELINDLDFDEDGDGSNNDSYNGEAGWTPLGKNRGTFTAIFEGNNYRILNLHSEEVDKNANHGFFSQAENATFKNVHFSGDLTSVSSDGDRVGGLVGYVSGATLIDNVSFKGRVIGDALTSKSVGGLVGLSNSVVITNSYVEGDISGNNGIGGLIGETGSLGTVVSISQSFFIGSVSGSSSYVGGLIGEVYGSVDIQNCFSSGDIGGNDAVGGLVGDIEDMLSISNSYAEGTVEGNYDLGGIAGYINTPFTVSHVYWDTTTSQIDSALDDDSVGLTSSELQTPITNSGVYANWDNAVWDFGSSNQYPALIINSKVYRDGSWDFVDDAEETSNNNNEEAVPAFGAFSALNLLLMLTLVYWRKHSRRFVKN